MLVHMANQLVSWGGGGGGGEQIFEKFFQILMKSEFNKIDYWNRARTITTTYKKTNIRLILELRDSRYISYYTIKF